MSRVPKLTVDSVLTYQRMNAIRDRLEEILGMLVADHGYDGSVFSTAETRLGKHAWRTTDGSSFPMVGTYLVRHTYSGGPVASCLAGRDEMLGEVSASSADYLTQLRFRGLTYLAAAATPIDYASADYTAVCSVVVERSVDPNVDWPWTVSVKTLLGTTSPVYTPSVPFVLQVWGY